jgi:hypothetical protein
MATVELSDPLRLGLSGEAPVLPMCRGFFLCWCAQQVGAADLLRTDLLRTDEGEVGGRAEPSYGVDRPNGRY